MQTFSKSAVNIAIVGSGYVADFYAKTLGSHPDLNLIAAYDHNVSNLEKFSDRWRTQPFTSLADLLADGKVELILNLTNPRSHQEITQSCLDAGKHVYSEKPLAMTYSAAQELAALAKARNLYLASAPCSLLGETAQTMWKALRDGVVGRVRLVYANFEDGMIAPRMAPWSWRNDAGVFWPAKDEFEVGCTYEHAGYLLTWLAAFFGPARTVTSFASCQIPDKGIRVDKMAPDFCVGCIEYDDDIVARVTCSLIAPRDKSLKIIGDEGVLYAASVRDDASPVYFRQIPSVGWRAGLERRLNSLREWMDNRISISDCFQDDWHFRKMLSFARRPSGIVVSKQKPVDFCRGPQEVADAIREKRASRLSARLGAHIVELIEAVQYPERFGGGRKIESTFDPIEPLPLDN